MSGHSKWSTIKHKKGAKDKKRGKIFTRLIKEIIIAVKEGGSGNLDINSRLRLAVQNAKGENMPKDTIERAIKKTIGNDSENYTEVNFEGYGPNGIAIFVEATTDNNNRTVSNIRAIFNKYGGNLSTNGSLEFIFERKGFFEIKINKKTIDTEELEMNLIDLGLEELKIENNTVFLYTSFEDFGNIQKYLEKESILIKLSEIRRIPINTKKIEIERAKNILTLIDKFEEDEDVSNVYHNLEITEEIIKEYI